VSGPLHSDRDRDAAQWFAARRRGIMSLEERTAYQEWLKDVDNASAMANLERIWEMVGIAEHHVAAEPAPSRGRLRPALVAAMCAASIGIAALSYSGNPGFWTTLDWTDR